MGVRERQRAVRAMRGQMWSPGRPSTARREDRVRFWRVIARGLSSEDAAAVAGVAQAVGSRWFRQAGGMPPISLAPTSGRYLSFAEREEIAILHAQQVGVRAVARQLGRSPSTISRELRRNGLHSHVSPRVPGVDGAVARRAASQPPEGSQARRERTASRVRARPPRGEDRQA
jgi:transposase